MGNIDFSNLRLEKPYDPQREYAQSKLADLVFAIELQRRIKANGDTILSVAAHPGVTNIDLSRYMSQQAYEGAIKQLGSLTDTAQGALPALFTGVSPDVRPGGFLVQIRMED